MNDRTFLRQPAGGHGHAATWLVALIAVIVAAHHGLVVADIGEAATVVINLGFVFVAVGTARRFGLDAREVGVRLQARSWVIACAVAVVGAAAGVAVAIALIGLLRTPSNAGPIGPGLWFRMLVAIPVGTALCEEVLFRGVLLATWDRLTTGRRSIFATSLMFGVWHLASEARRTGAFGVSVLPGMVATAAVSAIVLCPMRRGTGDIAAPTVLHAATNAGVLALVTIASVASS